jgi:hypothetical protein
VGDFNFIKPVFLGEETVQKNPLIGKGLVIGIIFLFVGVVIAPSINFNVVKASSDNDLIEVTTEVYGIKGFGLHTVMLTTQQYGEVKHLMESIKEQLREAANKEETIAIFKDAVVTLNTYGLIPQGMTIEQTQKLVVGEYKNFKVKTIGERLFPKNTIQTNQSNFLCFLAGIVHDGFVTGPLGLIGAVIAAFGLILTLNFMAIIGLLLMGISNFITTISPVSLLQRVTIHSGDITSVGLGGVKNFNISVETGGGIISGFTGIKISRNDTGQIDLLGVALGIKAGDGV